MHRDIGSDIPWQQGGMPIDQGYPILVYRVYGSNIHELSHVWLSLDTLLG